MNVVYKILRSYIKVLFGIGIVRSYSQDAEDLLAGIYLRSQKGTYVDVGAYHPIQYSNTYHFYKKGWTGIVIDPNPAFKGLYTFFRPRDTFVCCGVASVAQEQDYYLYSDGAYNTFSTERADELSKQTYPRFRHRMKQNIRPLRDILNENAITKIDFLSVDVEGLEIDVLESHDWDIRPKVIAIEDNAFDFENLGKSKVYAYLSNKDYKVVAGSPRTPVFIDSRVVV